MDNIYKKSNETIKEIIINLGINVFKLLEWDKLNEEDIIKIYNNNDNNNYSNELKEYYETKIKNINDNNEITINNLKNRINEIEINRDKSIGDNIKNIEKLHELEKKNLNDKIKSLEENNRLTELIEDKICDKKEFKNPTEQGDYVEKIFDEIVEKGLKYDTQAKINDTSDHGGSGDRIIKFSNGVVLMIEVKNKDTIKKSDIDEFKKCYEKDFRENKIDCALFFSYRTSQMPNICKAIIPEFYEEDKVIYYGIDGDNLTKPQKIKNIEYIIEFAYNSTNKRKKRKISEDNSNINVYNNYLSNLTSSKDTINKDLRENQKKTKYNEEKLSEIDKELNNLYRMIQINNIEVEPGLLDDKLYKKNLIERIKEWKLSSENGNKKDWKKYCIDELKLGERDISKIKNIKINELN